jgi:hypothetical protein
MKSSGGSRATKDGPDQNTLEFIRDFSGHGLTLALVNIYVKCIPPGSTDPTTCLPAPDAFVVVTDTGQAIVFKLQTSGRVYDNPGIKFDHDYLACNRDSDTQYTCTPNSNTPTGTYLKYTIKVYNAVPNDPYAFVRN